jgi:Beta-galactosidase
MLSREFEDPGRGPTGRRVLSAFAVFGCAALAGAAMVVIFVVLFVRLSWPHVEPLGNPEFGINFSCNQAEYLLLEDPAAGPAGYVADDRPGRVEWCAATLSTILRESGAPDVRISVEWSQVEPAEGRYDFTLVDALLTAAQQAGARVMLGVGIKAQRHPEFYIPPWLLDQVHVSDDEVISDNALVHDRALEMVRAIVAHTAESSVIDSWQADNEPYIATSRASSWTLSRAFAAEEVAAIRAADPSRRPVSINQAQHFVFDRRWEDALADSDLLAASLYPFRNYELFGHQFVVPILEIGPLAPNYAQQAREAHSAAKQFWITELQAEPWVDQDIRLTSPAHPSPNLTPANFRKNIEYARRSGADRGYLWGSEWWLYEEQKFGDGQWMQLARQAIAIGSP